MRRPVTPEEVRQEAEAAKELAAGPEVGRRELAAAVRTSLKRLADRWPGKLIEVRVPPFAAVQVGVPGVASAHTRGTPPNVVETDAATWLALASGRLSWPDALATHVVAASGAHADLSEHLVGAVQQLERATRP